MARGKNSRRRASLDAPTPTVPRKDRRGAAPGRVQPPVGANSVAHTPEEIHEAIEFHWQSLSLDLKQFLLKDPHELNLRKFVDYWTAPSRCENTNPNIASSICGCSWYLALNYMSIGKLLEARALILNGCFLQQCFNKPIDEIVAISDSIGEDPKYFRDELPFFTDGLLAISSPERIASFLRNKVSSDYQRRMSFATQTAQTKEKVRDYVGQISDDWGAGQPAARGAAMRRRASLAGPAGPDAARIEIRLVDGRTGEGVAVPYGVSTSLRALFKKYAEDRGTSLRQLRFSHKGRPLFLSSVGHKTPGDLGIGHLDDIVVTDTTPAATALPRDDGASSSDEEARARAGAPNERPSRRPSRSCRRASWAGAEILGAEERCKLAHSARLSKVFAEAAPRFALRRQQLNALTLARRPPKAKAMRRKSPVQVAPLPSDFLEGGGTGGKAGVPFYAVHVGAAEHLYHTRRPTSSRGKALSVDLHGLTRAEARAKLDAALPGWVATAMAGPAPWVVPVTIVCGGGSQVLAEAVEGWIREHDSVARAPRRCSRRGSI